MTRPNKYPALSFIQAMFDFVGVDYDELFRGRVISTIYVPVEGIARTTPAIAREMAQFVLNDPRFLQALDRVLAQELAELRRDGSPDEIGLGVGDAGQDSPAAHPDPVSLRDLSHRVVDPDDCPCDGCGLRRLKYRRRS
jgi:hypothetical protein